MKNKSLGINALLNTIKTLMAVIFPLITFPYISNVLEKEALGKYNFANSIISYFLMIAALGIVTYAVREGAGLKNDREKLNKFSSQMIMINLISSFITYGLMFLTVLIVPKFHNYQTLIYIFSIEILFTTIGIEWIFIIFEDYLFITIRKVAFQVISLILMFVFVKGPEDVIIYAFITVFANAGANIINLFCAKKYIDFKPTFNLDLKKHLKPILIIFASTLAIKIYTSLDVVMIGFIKTDVEVGVYSVAIKVYNVIKPVLSAVLVVAIPEISYQISQGNNDKYNTIISKVFYSLITIVLPAAIGIFAISKDIIIILSNDGYLDANLSLKLFSFAIIFSVFSAFFNQCILIPNKREKDFLIATIISAIVNIILNAILIYYFSITGAAIATVISEFVSMLYCLISSRDLFKIEAKKRNIISSVIGSLLVLVFCIIITSLNLGLVLETIISIIGSIIIYLIIIVIFKNDLFIDIKDFINKKIKHID